MRGQRTVVDSKVTGDSELDLEVGQNSTVRRCMRVQVGKTIHTIQVGDGRGIFNRNRLA